MIFKLSYLNLNLAPTPGVDFFGTALKSRKRKEISSSLVYVLHKT